MGNCFSKSAIETPIDDSPQASGIPGPDIPRNREGAQAGPGASGDANDNGNDIQNGKGSKDKDSESAFKLGHVPCKFDKVGGCTAGNNCPFSHFAVESGAPKEICQWYIKGNCKFGHKCALAHLLPGQSIAMDRKNKKAAQLSNQSNGNHSNNQSGSDGHNKNNRRGRGGASNNGNGRERDRNGETKPDRFPSTLAGNLTATAPPVSEPSEQPAGDGSHLVSPQSDSTPTTATGLKDLFSQVVAADAASSPTVVQARPTVPKRFSSGKDGSSGLGYGPIGSPPNVNPLTYGGFRRRPSYSSNSNHDQFSPGANPPSNHIQPSTSPFAHEELQQQLFGTYVRGGPGERPEQSPIAIQRGGPWRPPLVAERNEDAAGSDEDDYEDFVPSSLNDLLTPEERKRRLNRAGGSRNAFGLGAEGSAADVGIGPLGSIVNMGMDNHLYSAALLLGDANAWKEIDRDRDTASMGNMGMVNHQYSRSVPVSKLLDARLLEVRLLEVANAGKEIDRDLDNISVASLSHRSTGMSDGFSPSHPQLATSNASGAFLHGPHYVRNGNITTDATASHFTRQITSQTFGETEVLGAVPSLSTRGGGRYESPYSIQAVNRATQPGSDTLSPNSRTLQSHAPGQSLRQGLAAGLSLLHFAPPGVSGLQNDANDNFFALDDLLDG